MGKRRRLCSLAKFIENNYIEAAGKGKTGQSVHEKEESRPKTQKLSLERKTKNKQSTEEECTKEYSTVEEAQGTILRRSDLDIVFGRTVVPL